MQALADFDKVIQLDSTNSLTYFNRAMLRTQIGDYNRALEDYDKVALYSPNNVLVYYNRAGVYAQLGEIERAVEDYTSAIKLYPDFANAYIYRGRLREDQHNAQHKGIAVKMQIVLHIDDEIREKDLHGHGKQAERREGQIERRVSPHDRRAKPVDKGF